MLGYNCSIKNNDILVSCKQYCTRDRCQISPLKTFLYLKANKIGKYGRFKKQQNKKSLVLKHVKGSLPFKYWNHIQTYFNGING